MYRCENKGCRKLVPIRTPQSKIVTDTRPQVYENKIKRGKQKGKIKRTEGHEIVKEINVCPKCYSDLTGKVAPVPRPSKKPEIIDTRRFRSAKDRPYRKKNWKNPKTAKGHGDKQTAKKGPIVEKINPLPKKNVRS